MASRIPNAVDRLIGHRLKARRREAGMSRAALARSLGVSERQMQDFESGLARVGASRIRRAASLLAVSTEYFFAYPDQPCGSDEEVEMRAERLARILFDACSRAENRPCDLGLGDDPHSGIAPAQERFAVRQAKRH